MHDFGLHLLLIEQRVSLPLFLHYKYRLHCQMRMGRFLRLLISACLWCLGSWFYRLWNAAPLDTAEEEDELFTPTRDTMVRDY